MSEQPLITVTDVARTKVVQIRDRDEHPERLALKLAVTGEGQGRYEVAMSLELLEEAGPQDLVQWHDDLPIVVQSDSIDKLRGSTLDLQGDLETGGIVLENPNRPEPPASPAADLDIGDADLSGEIPQRIQQLLEQHINPQIAAHGGRADLVAFEEGTAYLRLGGGCQGCGMAQVTLRQGIEKALMQGVPEVAQVVDVTDHASGTNPYYESAKK
ncbi:NifU family protein [Egibacter rhizosphaerae]|uniref:NifU family protein n=1 Tax=Egibacter rhizosphaerae TaxID=1670831 RepID=UPI00197AA08E|nr:NifU family protein [Egibacter rhizosphaerae]